MNQPAMQPLPRDDVPCVLFRVEHAGNTSFRNHSMFARNPNPRNGGPPTAPEFYDHLAGNRTPTRFLSFSNSWIRAMRLRERLEKKGRVGIVVVAIWAKGLGGVYDAEACAEAMASQLNRAGLQYKLKPEDHFGEYLIDGGILDEENRTLATSCGGGKRDQFVRFTCPGYYEITASLPLEYFSTDTTRSPLEQLEDEIYRHTGVRNDLYRDKLVMAFCGPSLLPSPIQIRYVENSTGRMITA